MAHLAEFNIARLHHPLDAEQNAEFVAALEPINAIAEATPGFVWRLTAESGASASYVDVAEIDDPNVIVNFSIWEDLESFRHFLTKSGHGAYLRRRRDWFETPTEANVVCWWIDEGDHPTVAEALARLCTLRVSGPTEQGWPLTHPFVPRPPMNRDPAPRLLPEL
ncbi:MAG: hypothetical protein FD127_3046 [Acidimicrobiaceae bacterium]|nr:MAG: hypothetical protein FD127_3046 [Acidimicrobiaceae bacterium]